MKFLLLIKERGVRPDVADPSAFNRVVREHVTRLMSNGTLDCAYYMLPKGGAAIINASSHEALLHEMRTWPGASQHEFEIHPLADLLVAIDDNYAIGRAGKEAK